MRLASLLTLSSLALAAPAGATAPSKKPEKPAMSQPLDLEAETRAWHQDRIARLTSEDGWLTLVGLHWLKEGDNRFGSAQDNDLDFPASAPAHVGTFTLKDAMVSLTVQPGGSLTKNGQPFTRGTLRDDGQGEPDVLGLGALRFHVIRRGKRLGVRVKDPHAEARRSFRGIPTYPVSAAWRIEARFEPAATPRTISVPNVLNTVEEMTSPGTLVFTVEGKEHRLTPVVEPGASKLFIIFADPSNRTETYGAGRFLSADMPRDGRVVLDFNRAYNPPCAFTPHATCPLPPSQNRLKLRVTAGEKRYGGH